MTEFEITELGQVGQQENMLERAQAQAMRRTRRAAGGTSGTRVGRLIAWRRPFVARPGTTNAR
jgi:hypothetical protein